jgi:monothiol glutaredoxin
MLIKEIQDKIQKIINENDVVLFMKGDASQPQCGFSFTVVRILNYLGVKFYDVNVLIDEEIRNGIKDFTNWPTIPQLYIKGNFIGGCDIVKDLFETSELMNIFQKEQIQFSIKEE